VNEQQNSLIKSYPTVPKQVRSQHKKLALFESGQILFAEKGYEYTTTKDIASHAGVSIGTFYRYFEDKRQLLLAIIEERIEQMMPPVVNWTDHSNLISSGFYKLLPELLAKDRELENIIQSAKNRLLDHMLGQLKQLRNQGLTWDDIDLETVSWCIINLLEHLTEKVEEGGTIHYEEIAKLICRMVYPPHILLKLKGE
jgi:TetR/AcrR family transcriptional repressor of mexJK operon